MYGAVQVWGVMMYGAVQVVWYDVWGGTGSGVS